MNLGDMLDELVLSVGLDSVDVRTVLTRGVNTGIVAATIKFTPQEQNTVGTGYVGGTYSGQFEMTNTDWLRIERVYNNTGLHPLWQIDVDFGTKFASFMNETTATYWGYSRGNIFCFPTPSTENTITYQTLDRPSRVVDDTDTIPIDAHIEYIMMVAMEYYWASKEETESQQLWSKVAERIEVSESEISLIQNQMRARKQGQS